MAGKNKKPDHTPRDYVDDINDPRCTWDPKGAWNKCHGDGKATTLGTYRTFTQATTTKPTEYLVQIRQGKTIISSFKMPKTGDIVPTDDEVIEEMKKQVK